MRQVAFYTCQAFQKLLIQQKYGTVRVKEEMNLASVAKDTAL